MEKLNNKLMAHASFAKGMKFSFSASWAKGPCSYTIYAIEDKIATVVQEFVDIDDLQNVKLTYNHPINIRHGIEYIETDSHILQADCAEGSFTECIPLPM